VNATFCRRTYIHAYSVSIHKYTRTVPHAYIHTHCVTSIFIYTCINTCICISVSVSISISIYISISISMYIYIHTHCVSIHNVARKVALHIEQTRALHATFCQHTYIHTHTSCQHTYIQICIHTYIQTYIHTYIHTCIRTYIYTYAYVLPTYTQTHPLSQHTEYDMKCSIAYKTYGVATVSRIDQIIGLFCRILVTFVGLFCKRTL